MCACACGTTFGAGWATYLPLAREVSVSRGYAHQKGVVARQSGRVVERRDGAVLGRRVHLGKHIVAERLGDLVEVDLATGRLDPLLLSHGQLFDVAIHGVLTRSAPPPPGGVPPCQQKGIRR